jgi:hypothetical protein
VVDHKRRYFHTTRYRFLFCSNGYKPYDRLVIRIDLSKIGPGRVIEIMFPKIRNGLLCAVYGDGKIMIPKSIIRQEGNVFCVIEVEMGNEDIPDPVLFLESENIRDVPRIDEYPLIDQETGRSETGEDTTVTS